MDNLLKMFAYRCDEGHIFWTPSNTTGDKYTCPDCRHHYCERVPEYDPPRGMLILK